MSDRKPLDLVPIRLAAQARLERKDVDEPLPSAHLLATYCRDAVAEVEALRKALREQIRLHDDDLHEGDAARCTSQETNSARALLPEVDRG